MRAVIVGAGSVAVILARSLLARGHEVVMIDSDKERVKSISDSLDCGLLHGDGTKPAILKEADPEHTGMLFCLTGDDKSNILASLVGRSLGFRQVVTKIDDPELEHVCMELGLNDTIIPSRTTGQFLADRFEGINPLQLSTMMRDEARIFSFVLPEESRITAAGLELPDTARMICVYRQGKLIIPDDDTELRDDDEVIVIVQREALAKLQAQWGQGALFPSPAVAS